MQYILKYIAEKLGIHEGSKVLLRIEDNKIIIEPILNPFELFQKELLNHD